MYLKNSYLFSFVLFSALMLGGCMGIERRYAYESRQDEWKETSPLYYETRINNLTVGARVVGKWAGTEYGGPLFLPIVPAQTLGEFISVEVHVDKSTSISISSASMTVDRTVKLEPVRFLTGYGNATAVFRRPDYEPDTIEIDIKTVRLNQSELSLPPLNLVLRKKSCLWYGDSTPIYIGCGDWH